MERSPWAFEYILPSPPTALGRGPFASLARVSRHPRECGEADPFLKTERLRWGSPTATTPLEPLEFGQCGKVCFDSVFFRVIPWRKCLFFFFSVSIFRVRPWLILLLLLHRNINPRENPIVANLLSSSRAKQAIVQATFLTTENSLIDTLCTVVSALIRNYTRRELLLANHDELVSALTEDALFLRQYPITTITQVSLASSDPLADVGGYHIDSTLGLLTRISGTWLLGKSNYRVQYEAGYPELPADLVEAAAQWVAALYWQSKDNPAFAPDLPTQAMKRMLAPYRRILT